MGKEYDCLDESLVEFIERQPMFFVATAPSGDEGHLNVSPKGLDSFRVLDSKTVAYADLFGSGVETIAHLKQNGRIVVMFCAFESAPKIVRLHGRGEVVDPAHPAFADLTTSFPTFEGLRCFIRIHCDRFSDSCGFGVPLMDYRGQRTQLVRWAEQKNISDLEAYGRTRNAKSIDGLPGWEPST